MKIRSLVLMLIAGNSAIAAEAPGQLVALADGAYEAINAITVEDFASVHFESNHYLEEPGSDHPSRYESTCADYRDLNIAKAVVTRFANNIRAGAGADLGSVLADTSEVQWNALSTAARQPYVRDQTKGHYVLTISSELLVYHNKVTGTDNWEQKFDSLDGQLTGFGSLKRGVIFHEAGFPAPADACYLSAVGFNDSNGRLVYTEFDATLEAWLYSFWYRRYREGSFNTTRYLLDLVVEALEP